MIFFLILSVLFNIYFVVLQILSPSTFLGTFFSFSSVWFYLAVVCLFIFFFRRLFCRIAKFIKIVVCSLLGVAVIVAGINLFFICTPRVADGTENPEYVILLGGGITKDAELSDNVKKRVECASEYLKKNPNAICVVTGGKGKFSPCPESDVLKPALESYGISADRILAENKAKDTIQNFKYSAELLSDFTGKTVSEILNSQIAVVTSDFHLARAERLAKRMGFTNIFGVASKTPLIFVPSMYAREILCYVKLNLRILFTGKPSFIG